MMNAEEKEYMDYLIHNRTELTKQITRHLDNLLLLQKKLDIAVKTLEEIKRKSDTSDNSLAFIQLDYIKADCQAALYHLKEIEEEQ